jgi:hypothetical protein
VNKLTINFNKTHYISFTASNNSHTPKIEIAYGNKQITTISNTKFLWVYIDNRINWECHIEYTGSKLITVCYMMRAVKPYTYKYHEKSLLLFFQLSYAIWTNILGKFPPEYKNL